MGPLIVSFLSHASICLCLHQKYSFVTQIKSPRALLTKNYFSSKHFTKLKDLSVPGSHSGRNRGDTQCHRANGRCSSSAHADSSTQGLSGKGHRVGPRPPAALRPRGAGGSGALHTLCARQAVNRGWLKQRIPRSLFLTLNGNQSFAIIFRLFPH